MKSAKFCLIAAVLCALALSSCKTFEWSQKPDWCGESLIYELIPNPEAAELVITVAVFEVVKHKPEWREPVALTLDFLSVMLEEPGVTYFQFASWVAAQVKFVNQYAGSELVIVSEVLGRFDRRIPITDCDRELLHGHIAREKRYLAMAK
jgi:hypothetical protein